MTLAETLISVWKQVLLEGKKEVRLGPQSYPVKQTRSRKLAAVDFEYAGVPLTGLEQNPQKSSRWAQLARKGKKIMQFSCQGRYVGNVCEGRLTRYAAWHDLRLTG